MTRSIHFLHEAVPAHEGDRIVNTIKAYVLSKCLSVIAPLEHSRSSIGREAYELTGLKGLVGYDWESPIQVKQAMNCLSSLFIPGQRGLQVFKHRSRVP